MPGVSPVSSWSSRTGGGADRLAERQAGECIRHVTAGQLPEQVGHLLKGGGRPRPGARVDAEVEADGSQLGLGESEADRHLGRDLLQVSRARVRHERKFAVVDRDLRQDRGQGAEPERQAGAGTLGSALVELDHMSCGGSPQVSNKGVGGDGCHDVSPLEDCRQ